MTAAEPAGPILACFAHPDDAEIGAGGCLAKWSDEGREVHLLILTNGDRGSGDVSQDRAKLATTRALEQAEAGRILGVKEFRVLETADGELENVPAVRAAVVRVIREVRPQILVSCDPSTWFLGNRYINHADHRNAGAIACDAVFPGAGNPHFFAEQIEEGLEPWDVPTVWLAWSNDPNHREDITGYMQRKVDALRAHRSQLDADLLRFFDEWLPREAEDQGRMIGVQHAEAFRVLSLR